MSASVPDLHLPAARARDTRTQQTDLRHAAAVQVGHNFGDAGASRRGGDVDDRPGRGGGEAAADEHVEDPGHEDAGVAQQPVRAVVLDVLRALMPLKVTVGLSDART